jgi:hypothetical protein
MKHIGQMLTLRHQALSLHPLQPYFIVEFLEGISMTERKKNQRRD